MPHPSVGALPRPNFPFAVLLEEFTTPEEENEATAAIEAAIDEVKEAAKRD